MLNQTFEPHDLIIVAFLVVLEGVLSIDNALVLGILARRLPKALQPRALSYGLIGALVFRVLAIITAGYLLQWRFPKLLGGLYLLYVAAKHFFAKKDNLSDADADACKETAQETLDDDMAVEQRVSTHSRFFWQTVIAIELTDIAFAVDSIVAAMGMVADPGTQNGQRFHPKLWLVVTGGMLGVVAMRFAAAAFIKLLDKFPRFETAAHLLVLLIGAKLVLEFFFHHMEFHSVRRPEFWAFWIGMVICFSVGFIKPKDAAAHPHRVTHE